MLKYAIIFEGMNPPDIANFELGAHILVETQATNYHTLIVSLEDAGWEVRDCLKWFSRDGSYHFALLRKPFSTNMVNQVIAHGVGGLNIDGSRIDLGSDVKTGGFGNGKIGFGGGDAKGVEWKKDTTGRFPANLLHDGSQEIVARFPGDSKKSTSRFFKSADRQDLITYLLSLITPPQ